MGRRTGPNDDGVRNPLGEVHIIGMMNTADRSLTTLDYALHRRFAFSKVRPGFSHPNFRKHLEANGWSTATVGKIVERFEALNVLIANDDELREGFCVGHSYFCAAPPFGLSDESFLDEIVETEIAPLLEDYWFGMKATDLSTIINKLTGS